MRPKSDHTNATGPLANALWRRVAPCLLLLLGGCSGAPGDRPTEGDARTGAASGVATAAGLRFVVIEDRELAGVLSDATQPGASATLPFRLIGSTSHGELQLLADGLSFEYVPDENFNGTDGFDYETFDGRALRVTIDITPVPDSPTLDLGGPLIAERGEFFVRQLVASDADGDVLQISAQRLPSWLTLDTDSRLLSGTPSANDVGRVNDIAFAVVDPTGRREDLRDIVLEVVEPSASPRLDLAQVPEQIDGRSSLTVPILPQAVALDGITLTAEVRFPASGFGVDPADVGNAPQAEAGGAAVRVEAQALLDVRVTGRDLSLSAADIEAVTRVDVVIDLTDRLGATRQGVVPVTLIPRNVSGRGRTLLGRRDGRGVHVAVFGDGYRRDQQARLEADARTLIDVLQSDTGIASHLGAFNVHVVESISVDEGIDNGAFGENRDTLYDGYYDCLGVPQLICADAGSLFIEAIGEYADVSQVVLFANDTTFGGSGNNGGGVAIAVRDIPEIALHEMGHSLAGLADEYVDSELVNTLATGFTEGDYPNVTTIDDPVRAPWARWIEAGTTSATAATDGPAVSGVGPVGLYEGALYRADDFFRPTVTSRMREYGRPFGPVNAEQWVLGVYKTADVVRDFQPQKFSIELVAGNSQRFSVSPYFPADVQAITWYFDDQQVRAADGVLTFDITPSVGRHRVRLEVRDVSGRIRLEPPHDGYFDWEWEVIVQ